ncbi:transmembrane anchor protein [Thalassobaculum sp.]|uniref:transmembrane anchor protein n=1 Tax=Thalassobaculum sp. TaxID=2022740 RepID=UPI003B595F93
MNNAQEPTTDGLPNSAQLLRSTLIALAVAIVTLVTVILPSEYSIDPTGVGRLLGFAEVGGTEQQLAAEATQGRKTQHGTGDQSSALDVILGLFVSTAHAQEAWRDEAAFTLGSGEPIETKMVMKKGETVEYEWTAEGGRMNFDLHGHGGGNSVTYEKGRGQTSGKGSFTATFDGEHGWFWRNRDSSDVTVMLKVRGEYSEFKRSQ